MSHLVCSVCTGHHHPENCPTAQRFLSECRMSTPGDFHRPRHSIEATIVDLTEYTYRKQHAFDLARRSG